MKGSSSSRRADEDDDDTGGDDTESKVSTTVAAPTIRGGEGTTLAPPPSFKVKRVDYYYSWWTRSWKYRVRYTRGAGGRSLVLSRVCGVNSIVFFFRTRARKLLWSLSLLVLVVLVALRMAMIPGRTSFLC